MTYGCVSYAWGMGFISYCIAWMALKRSWNHQPVVAHVPSCLMEVRQRLRPGLKTVMKFGTSMGVQWRYFMENIVNSHRCGTPFWKPSDFPSGKWSKKMVRFFHIYLSLEKGNHRVFGNSYTWGRYGLSKTGNWVSSTASWAYFQTNPHGNCILPEMGFL